MGVSFFRFLSDHRLVADLLHRVSNEPADLRITIRRDRSYLCNLLVRRNPPSSVVSITHTYSDSVSFIAKLESDLVLADAAGGRMTAGTGLN